MAAASNSNALKFSSSAVFDIPHQDIRLFVPVAFFVRPNEFDPETNKEEGILFLAFQSAEASFPFSQRE